jgi:hypothetical protein
VICPECKAEYLPNVRRCSDCDVPLVEKPPVRDCDSVDRQRSGFVLFKEWGVFFILPILLLTITLCFVAFVENQLGIQIISMIACTEFVFLLVFCDTRGWKGYSLGEKAVRQKLILLLCIHAGFLAFIFAGVTIAMVIHPHLSLFWTVGRDRGGRGRFSNLSYFDHISILSSVAIVITETLLCRGILARALKNEQKTRDSKS